MGSAIEDIIEQEIPGITCLASPPTCQERVLRCIMCKCTHTRSDAIDRWNFSSGDSLQILVVSSFSVTINLTIGRVWTSATWSQPLTAGPILIVITAHEYHFRCRDVLPINDFSDEAVLPIADVGLVAYRIRLGVSVCNMKVLSIFEDPSIHDSLIGEGFEVINCCACSTTCFTKGIKPINEVYPSCWETKKQVVSCIDNGSNHKTQKSI